MFVEQVLPGFIASRPANAIFHRAVTAYLLHAHVFREEIEPNVCRYTSTVHLQGQWFSGAMIFRKHGKPFSGVSVRNNCCRLDQPLAGADRSHCRRNTLNAGQGAGLPEFAIKRSTAYPELTRRSGDVAVVMANRILDRVQLNAIQTLERR